MHARKYKLKINSTKTAKLFHRIIIHNLFDRINQRSTRQTMLKSIGHTIVCRIEICGDKIAVGYQKSALTIRSS